MAIQLLMTCSFAVEALALGRGAFVKKIMYFPSSVTSLFVVVENSYKLFLVVTAHGLQDPYPK